MTAAAAARKEHADCLQRLRDLVADSRLSRIEAKVFDEVLIDLSIAAQDLAPETAPIVEPHGPAYEAFVNAHAALDRHLGPSVIGLAAEARRLAEAARRAAIDYAIDAARRERAHWTAYPRSVWTVAADAVLDVPPIPVEVQACSCSLVDHSDGCRFKGSFVGVVTHIVEAAP